MAIDFSRVVQAAAEAALEGRGSGSQPKREKKRRGLSVPRTFLIGAGVVTAGRLVAASRGRGMLENLQQRLADYEHDHFDDEEPYDDFDEEPEAEEDEDFDEEPEAEEDEDFDEEPEAAEDEDFDEEPEAAEDEDYDEEPEAAEDEDYDEEPEAAEDEDLDEEPEAEAEEDFDEEAEPPRRRRARAGSSSNGRGAQD